MTGHIAQHLAECQTHAVTVVADIQAYWFPLAQRATVQPLEVAPQAAGVFIQCPGSDGPSHERRHLKWAGMHAK